MGRTALHLAALEGKVDVVKLLTEAGAQLNIQDEVWHWYSCMCHMIPCSSTSRPGPLSSHTVLLYIAALGELTVFLCTDG